MLYYAQLNKTAKKGKKMTNLTITVPMIAGEVAVFKITSSDDFDTLIENVGDIESIEDFQLGIEMGLWSIA